jgi:hypothetical protein
MSFPEKKMIYVLSFFDPFPKNNWSWRELTKHEKNWFYFEETWLHSKKYQWQLHCAHFGHKSFPHISSNIFLIFLNQNYLIWEG